VVASGPLGGAPVPARRLGGIVGELPVLGEERGALIELVRVEVLDGPGDGGVDASAAGAELGAVGDLLRQRVLEGVLDLRIERLL
jgi:hypothetical protein